MTVKPKLRFVEALPLNSNTHQFVLRDPAGIVDEMAVVSLETLYVLQHFDGEHDFAAIRSNVRRDAGKEVTDAQLHQLIDQLERFHLMEGERFEAYKTALAKSILDQPARPATHAGVSYPAEGTELRALLDSFYDSAAGKIEITIGKRPAKTATIAGAVVPHIDLRVGGQCYTYAYKAIAESEPADIYVVLGTGHGGLANCFSCLPKDFETPLGPLRHDAAFIEALAHQLSFSLFDEPIPHRKEHTIEFQTIFLQHLWGGRHTFSIVPILCSYAYPMLIDDRFGRERQTIIEFSRALCSTISRMTATGKKVTVIASADFSHVGLQYGEVSPPDRDFLNRVRHADQQLLDAITAVDAVAFVNANAQAQDRYRVCGFAPIHTLLSTVDATAGRLLKYEQGVVDDRGSVVSYASMILC